MTAPSPFLMEYADWFWTASFVLFAVVCALARLEDAEIWVTAIVPSLFCTVIFQQATDGFGEWERTFYLLFWIAFYVLHAIVGHVASSVWRGFADPA